MIQSSALSPFEPLKQGLSKKISSLMVVMVHYCGAQVEEDGDDQDGRERRDKSL